MIQGGLLCDDQYAEWQLRLTTAMATVSNTPAPV